MKINTQRQKYAHFPARAIFFAFFAGIVCGLFLAAWWRLAQIKQSNERTTLAQIKQSNERTTLVQH